MPFIVKNGQKQDSNNTFIHMLETFDAARKVTMDSAEAAQAPKNPEETHGPTTDVGTLDKEAAPTVFGASNVTETLNYVETDPNETSDGVDIMLSPAPLPAAGLLNTTAGNTIESNPSEFFKETRKRIELYRKNICYKYDVLQTFFDEIKRVYGIERLIDAPSTYQEPETFRRAVLGTDFDLSASYYKKMRTKYQLNEQERRKRRTQRRRKKGGHKRHKAENREPKHVELEPATPDETPCETRDITFDEWFEIGQRLGYLVHALTTYKLEVTPRAGLIQPGHKQ